MRFIFVGSSAVENSMDFAQAGDSIGKRNYQLLTKSMQEQSKPEFRLRSRRFTIDGRESLESRLADICSEALDCVQSIVPKETLEALVLGAAYGRGQGGA